MSTKSRMTQYRHPLFFKGFAYGGLLTGCVVLYSRFLEEWYKHRNANEQNSDSDSKKAPVTKVNYEISENALKTETTSVSPRVTAVKGADTCYSFKTFILDKKH